MTETERLIPDAQIDSVWGNADFGEKIKRRDVVDNTVLKCASGYRTGHTAAVISSELGLVNIKSWTLTKLGKQYLWAAYSDGVSL